MSSGSWWAAVSFSCCSPLFFVAVIPVQLHLTVRALCCRTPAGWLQVCFCVLPNLIQLQQAAKGMVLLPPFFHCIMCMMPCPAKPSCCSLAIVGSGPYCWGQLCLFLLVSGSVSTCTTLSGWRDTPGVRLFCYLFFHCYWSLQPSVLVLSVTVFVSPPFWRRRWVVFLGIFVLFLLSFIGVSVSVGRFLASVLFVWLGLGSAICISLFSTR